MTVTAELKAQALRMAASLEPAAMSGEAAAEGVAELALAEKAVATARMFLAVRVAQTDAWRGQGYASPADWLAAKAGITVTEAARQLGTAKKADRLPKTKEAMRKGELSPTQADAVTDAAAVDPGAEDELLDAAAAETTKGLRDLAARRKAAATSSKERDERIRRHRSLRRGTDAEGAFWARLYGPGVSAAAFEELLKPFEELIFRQHRADGVESTHENRAFDAFFAMLAFLRQADAGPGMVDEAPEPPSGPGPSSEPEPEPEAASDARRSPSPSPSPGPAPPVWRPPWAPGSVVPLPAKRPGGNNVKVIVRVDHAALLRGCTLAGETCEIAGVGPIPVEAVRQILRDDAFLAVVVRKGRDVVSVAHHGRGLNAHQRTALEADELRCTNLSCNRTVAMEVDHRVPWAVDPITALPNQDLVCSGCHRLKTHHGHAFEAGTGRRRLLPPGHPDHPGVPPDPAPPASRDAHADAIEARICADLVRRGTPIPERLRARAARAAARAAPVP